MVFRKKQQLENADQPKKEPIIEAPITEQTQPLQQPITIQELAHNMREVDFKEYVITSLEEIKEYLKELQKNENI